MKVSQLAQLANVTAETVRYYTREGLLTAERNPSNGYKIYDQTALQRLNFITQARSLGFSLKEIKGILKNAAQGDSPCPMVRQLLQDKITKTEAEIAALQTVLDKMKTVFADWQDKADAVPCGNSVCHLIESVER